MILTAPNILTAVLIMPMNVTPRSRHHVKDIAIKLKPNPFLVVGTAGVLLGVTLVTQEAVAAETTTMFVRAPHYQLVLMGGVKDLHSIFSLDTQLFQTL